MAARAEEGEHCETFLRRSTNKGNEGGKGFSRYITVITSAAHSKPKTSTESIALDVDSLIKLSSFLSSYFLLLSASTDSNYSIIDEI